MKQITNNIKKTIDEVIDNTKVSRAIIKNSMEISNNQEENKKRINKLREFLKFNFKIKYKYKNPKDWLQYKKTLYFYNLPKNRVGTKIDKTIKDKQIKMLLIFLYKKQKKDFLLESYKFKDKKNNKKYNKIIADLSNKTLVYDWKYWDNIIVNKRKQTKNQKIKKYHYINKTFFNNEKELNKVFNLLNVIQNNNLDKETISRMIGIIQQAYLSNI